MVSELSAKLMRGNTFNSTTTSATGVIADLTTSRSNAVVSPINISDHEPMMTIMACTEKLHKISTKSPKKKMVRSASSTAGKCGYFKRRKVDELQFAASRVKCDLRKGGLSYPALEGGLRHHGVSLVCSESFSDSPFLTKNASNCSEVASVYDFGCLFEATYDSYSKPSSNVNSSKASYVSISDAGSVCSSTSESSELSSIAPRLEDGLNSKKLLFEATSEEKEEPVATASQHRAVYSSPITIRDAFENTEEARLVTLSFAPFLVVHANPAYTRMTGLSPGDILGKPFHELIEDPTCKSETAKASSLTSLHEKVTSFLQSKEEVDSDNNKFRIHISIVGGELSEQPANSDNTNVVTHYMISLDEHQDPKEEPDVVTTVLALAVPVTNPVVPPFQIVDTSILAGIPTMRLHCGVMG